MRRERGFPTLDNDGYIDLESVNNLTFRELERWLYSVLHGSDPAAGGGRFELIHVFLSRVYQNLNPAVRECFRDITLNFLDSLASAPQSAQSDWNGESADELLLLTGMLFREGQQTRTPVDVIYAILEQKSFEKYPTLRRRALQTLVSIRHRGHPEFWHAQFSQYGEDYALVTVAGLSVRGIRDLADWVKVVPGNESVCTALLSRLPWLVEEYGSDAVALLIEEINAYLPATRQREVLDFCSHLGLHLDLSLDFFSDWPEEELRKLAIALRLGSPGIEERPALQTTLERTLRQVAVGYTSRVNLPELDILIGSAELLRNSDANIPQSIRERFADLGRSLLQSEDLTDRDRILVEQSVCILRYSGVDLMHEIASLARG